MGTNTPEYFRNYYKLNRDKLLNYANEKIICELCGSSVARNHLSRHKKGYRCKKIKQIINTI